MTETTHTDHESFRDSIATIKADGSRNWIYPKKPSGRFYNRRTILSYFLLALLFIWPWVKINGHPVFLFNILERKFIFFGIAFWPQDTFLFALLMLTFFVFIILFTVLFGRLWCGWVCPQTIFMEMLFRKIEYFIEGDYMAQKALNQREWDSFKIRKKVLKNVIFFFISFLIANTFLAYIIGSDQLVIIITDNPSEHLGGLFAIMAFTGVFYGVYVRFREQACIVVCPYGRLQGVLLDPNSVVIAYDYKRGEPRHKISKQENNSGFGDCIDCHACFHVCPTGIDIRNGTQLECVNCTACIDACDDIMDKVKKPRGLIRYTSENAIATGQKFKVTTRVYAYSLVLLVLSVILFALLLTRNDIETTVLRTPGMIYQKVDDNHISNLYNIKLVNKTFDDHPLIINVVKPEGATIKWIGNGIAEVKEGEIAEGEFFIVLPKSAIKAINMPVEILVTDDKGRQLDKTNTKFIGPN